MNVINFLFYQIERVRDDKSQVSFYLPEPDMNELLGYLDEEFIYLAQGYYRHPELKINIFMRKDGYVLLILGEKNERI